MWGHGVHHCTWASTICRVMGFTITPGLLPRGVMGFTKKLILLWNIISAKIGEEMVTLSLAQTSAETTVQI